MTFRPVNEPSHLYFVTATVSGWKKLFEEEAFIQIILDSMEWLCENKRMELYVFVLMPNHLHFICRPLEPHNISKLKQNFGSFTAHSILKRLRDQNRAELLSFFHQEALDAKDGSNFKIWKDIQAKNIYSKEFLLQKIEYIHNNPLQPKWQLVENRSAWPYSSACFYDEDKEAFLPISDVRPYLV